MSKDDNANNQRPSEQSEEGLPPISVYSQAELLAALRQSYDDHLKDPASAPKNQFFKLELGDQRTLVKAVMSKELLLIYGDSDGRVVSNLRKTLTDFVQEKQQGQQKPGVVIDANKTAQLAQLRASEERAIYDGPARLADAEVVMRITQAQKAAQTQLTKEIAASIKPVTKSAFWAGLFARGKEGVVTPPASKKQSTPSGETPQDDTPKMGGKNK